MKAFMIAGEPSGDRLGAALMEGLRSEVPDIAFDGIGGAMMQGLGLHSLFAMDELTLMGIVEILPKYRHLKRRIRQTADAIIAAKPDVLITIDSPDFSLRVARLVKEASDIRTVHYVAPTVWAWRPGRATKMAAYIDHVLALFPFEPPYMTAAGMACDFVGHPVSTVDPVTADERARFQAKMGVGAGPVLTILPGSRRSEIARLGPIFEDVFSKVAGDFAAVLIPTLPHLVEHVQRVLPLNAASHCQIVSGDGLPADTAARDRLVAMACADVALAASGTVSLELAAVRTPMVIAYKMNWLSQRIIDKMLRTDTVTLVNLVSDTRVVPEFIGARCDPALIAQGLRDALHHPDAQLAALDLTMDRLGRGGPPPGLRAARAILARL